MTRSIAKRLINVHSALVRLLAELDDRGALTALVLWGFGDGGDVRMLPQIFA